MHDWRIHKVNTSKNSLLGAILNILTPKSWQTISWVGCLNFLSLITQIKNLSSNILTFASKVVNCKKHIGAHKEKHIISRTQRYENMNFKSSLCVILLQVNGISRKSVPFFYRKAHGCYSPIAFDERVTFWFQCVRPLPYACAYVALYAREARM